MEEKKQMFLVTCIAVAALNCYFQVAAATPLHPPFVAVPDASEILVYNIAAVDDEVPVAVHRLVRRGTPVYVSKESRKDLATSATGYGHGGGYGGHGGYSPTGYVGYGARTGGYGAFSWYSDHPVGGGGYGYGH